MAAAAASLAILPGNENRVLSRFTPAAVHHNGCTSPKKRSSLAALFREPWMSLLSSRRFSERATTFQLTRKIRASALSDEGESAGGGNNLRGSGVDGSLGALLGDFCIIEGPDTVQDFARMELEEIRDNISSRRTRIFLLMEEIRRLRIQQRVKSAEQRVQMGEDDEEMPQYPSSIPFLPPLTSDTLRQYYIVFSFLVGSIIIFGGLIAPALELKLGVGGTSYAEFIHSLHLPSQLSAVDPIVASFSGGAVGVLSALMVVEVNNVKQQEHKRCMYCNGTGYLACARCSSTGALIIAEEGDGGEEGGDLALRPTAKRCPNCAGSSKVMCPTCLCTGMALATEHDPRIDPFD